MIFFLHIFYNKIKYKKTIFFFKKNSHYLLKIKHSHKVEETGAPDQIFNFTYIPHLQHARNLSLDHVYPQPGIIKMP